MSSGRASVPAVETLLPQGSRVSSRPYHDAGREVWRWQSCRVHRQGVFLLAFGLMVVETGVRSEALIGSWPSSPQRMGGGWICHVFDLVERFFLC